MFSWVYTDKIAALISKSKSKLTINDAKTSELDGGRWKRDMCVDELEAQLPLEPVILPLRSF